MTTASEQTKVDLAKYTVPELYGICHRRVTHARFHATFDGYKHINPS